MSRSENVSSTERPRRRRLAPLVWLGSAAAAAVVALGVSGTLSGFTASIDNTTNTAATGTLLMSETDGTATCYSNGTAAGVPDTNAGTCATINKFGGSTTMAPGVAGPTVTVTITNNGNINANVFTLTPDAACTQTNNAATTAHGSALDLCAKLNVKISTGVGTTGDVFTGTMAALGTHGAFTLPAVNGGANAVFTFQVTLDSTAGNTYQGLKASTGLTWAFGQ
jgi:hypothetical protein